jgi:hypothetical protein
VAFVLCLASAIWILLPHKMVFAFRGEALLAAVLPSRCSE